MKITVEIPDELTPGCESFLARYYSATPDIGIEGLVLSQVNALVDRVNEEFPPAEIASIQEQIATLKDQARSSLRATVISDAPTERTK